MSVAAGSVLTVNYKQYPFINTESLDFLNSDGSVTLESNLSAGTYYIVAKANLDDTCTCYMHSMQYTVQYNNTYGGYYIQNTQLRVIGGITKVTGGVYSDKWLLPNDGYITDTAFNKVYPNGNVLTIRRLNANYTGDKTTLNASAITAGSATVTVKYPCLLSLDMTYSKGSTGTSQTFIFNNNNFITIGAVIKEVDGSTERDYPSPTITANLALGDQSVWWLTGPLFTQKYATIPLQPGIYKVYAANTTVTSARLRNTFGSSVYNDY